MMGVWSHRPRLLHLGLFIAAYVLGCAFAQSLAIVPGTGISIWPPSGLFIATLVLAPPPSWPWWVLAGCLAEMASNFLWFHSPVPAAFLIYTGNALEAMAGAWLVNRILRRPVRLETLGEVLAFIVLGAGIAPIVSATVGSATLAWFGMQAQTFTGAWPLFWIGDATGVLIVAPLALAVFQNWRGTAQLSTARWIEACVLGLIFLGVAALSLSGYLPFAYIIMPPLLWASVRFEFKGAAVTLTLLALITAIFTISGSSQFAGDAESQRQKQIMLQLFLAISALSALIVAAISRQHQLALATLRQSKQQLQDMIDAVPALIWSTTPEGIPCYLNKRVTDITGITLKDLIASDGSRFLSVVHPDDRDATDKALARSFETGTSFVGRYRQRRANGPHRWVESRAEPLRDASGTIVQWYGVSVDIEDMMTAQQALQDRERELAQLVDMVPSHVWRLKPDGEPAFFNKRMVDFLGLDVADTDKPGMSRLAAVIETVIHPDDAAAFREILSHSLASGDAFASRYRLRRANGEYRWVEGRIEPLLNQDGTVLQWYGVSVDIDDQMRHYSDIAEREAKIRRLVDSDIIGIVIWDLDGRIIEANDAFLRMVQYEREDLQAGLRWFDMTPPEWQEVHTRYEAEELRTTGKMQPREKEFFKKDGSRVPVLIGAACFEGQSRQGVAYILDLTERKHAEAAQIRAEEALRRAQDKLAQASQAASLSELSASIAHEVNQPLAAIVANSHACHRWLSAEPPNVERAKITAGRIIRDANSAADIISRIRALFKQSVETRTGTTLSNVIAEARDLMAEEAVRHGVTITIDVEDDLPPVAFDRDQIQQVLVNLIRNGLEAMDMAADDRVLGMRVRQAGDFVRTQISDSGRGVEVPDKIFEPFFTTKERGMGMGLTISRSIVESHGGRLWVEKNEPHGATFIFTLPVEMRRHHENG